MGVLEHIPGTNPLPPVTPGAHRKGVGVLGLHEGRTMLVALATRTASAYPAAGCDTDPGKIAACRAELPGVFYTHDYAELLARPDVEIVAIYTPDSAHADHVVAAFEAGKDVICTKPLVNSVADAARVLAAGRRTGRRLLVGQSTRFFEPFRRQRAGFERGELGRLELIDAHYIHRMDWYYKKSAWAARDTDWVFLGLSHPIDLVRWYAGRVRRAQATASVSEMGRRFGVAGPDIYLVNLECESGAVARVMGHYGCHELPSARNCIELMLYGSGGSSLAQYHDMRYVRTGADNTEVTEDHLYAGRHFYFNSEVHGMHYGEFANYAEAFSGALIGGTPTSPELEEGVETFCVMEAVRRSARSGCAEDVAPILAEAGLR